MVAQGSNEQAPRARPERDLRDARYEEPGIWAPRIEMVACTDYRTWPRIDQDCDLVDPIGPNHYHTRHPIPR